MTPIDSAWARTRLGDPTGYADWVRLVEAPIRESLHSFARTVDTEAILQEALLRMWVLARRLETAGKNASLRYAYRIARNLALTEARRQGIFVPLEGDGDGGGGQVGRPAGAPGREPAKGQTHGPPGDQVGGQGSGDADGRNVGPGRLTGQGSPPDPPSDPILRRAILACIEALPARVRLAIVTRLSGEGAEPDRALAERCQMKLNTFLQNIVRARALLRKCLASRGVPIEELLP